MVSRAQEFANDVKMLAALQDPDYWEGSTSPWSAVAQVVNIACGHIDETSKSVEMPDQERLLADILVRQIHVVCDTLNVIQEMYYDRQEKLGSSTVNENQGSGNTETESDSRQKPSVGRIVRYVAPGSADGTYPPAVRAAIITDVMNDEVVSLSVMNPTGLHFVHSIARSDDKLPYTWHFPERV